MFLEVVRSLLRGVISFTGVPSGVALFKKVIAREKPTIGCDSPFFVK
jgi:hypothetical protein